MSDIESDDKFVDGLFGYLEKIGGRDAFILVVVIVISKFVYAPILAERKMDWDKLHQKIESLESICDTLREDRNTLREMLWKAGLSQRPSP